VNSGTLSPLLKMGIAMAYVFAEHATEGEAVEVKIRDNLIKGEIVKQASLLPQDFARPIFIHEPKGDVPRGDWKRLGI
jgi:glycine cleavage system aminomethyltransferase T